LFAGLVEQSECWTSRGTVNTPTLKI